MGACKDYRTDIKNNHISLFKLDGELKLHYSSITVTGNTSSNYEMAADSLYFDEGS